MYGRRHVRFFLLKKKIIIIKLTRVVYKANYKESRSHNYYYTKLQSDRSRSMKNDSERT